MKQEKGVRKMQLRTSRMLLRPYEQSDFEDYYTYIKDDELKHMQKRGFMTEALTTVVDYLFTNKKMDYIGCEYPSFNKGSRLLQEKLGFLLWGKEKLGDFELVINVLENKS